MYSWLDTCMSLYAYTSYTQLIVHGCHLEKLMLQLQPSFAISDGVAIDGSAVSYTLAYNDSISGVSCGSATVPASSCVDGVCQHSFTYEESACSSPSIGVNVTISAANVLGSGPASYPNTVEGAYMYNVILLGNNTFNYTYLFYAIDQTNKFVSVTFDLVTNSIVCNFHNQGQILSGSKKFCSIDYGPEGESCSSYSQTSHGTSDVVRIGLPLQLSSTGQYCFSVTGNNGTYTAVVEGTFKPGRVNVTHGNAYASKYMINVTVINFISSIWYFTWTLPNVCDFGWFWCDHYFSCNHCVLSPSIQEGSSTACESPNSESINPNKHCTHESST